MSEVVIFRLISAILIFSIASSGHAESRLRVEFNPVDGRLTELSNGENLLEAGTNRIGLWKVEAAGIALLPEQAKHFESRALGKNGRELTWKEFGLAAAPDLKVVVTVRVEKEMSRWNLAMENPGKLELQRIRFPRVPGIRRQTNEFLAVPEWMGQLAVNPRKLLTNSARLEWYYPGQLSLQCLAYYSKAGLGLSFMCDDTAAYRKSFSVFGDENGGVNFEMVHLVERGSTPGRHYKIPYAALVGTFHGDWFTVAEQYRAWGTNQAWARASRLRRNMEPEWVLKTGMWVWNRGRSENVLEPATVLEKELGLPVSVFWHWWHGCAYDTGFPEYLPPREGAESFTRALAAAHGEGIHAIVYMNQRLWGMKTGSWKTENAAAFAVKGEDGTIRPEIYNSFTKLPCASMCMGTEFWRSKYAGQAETAIKDLKVDGIYMDQACGSLSCYDPTHKHPPGGGRYWMQGFQELSTDIRRGAGTAVTLGGEGCGEAWLPYLDLMLTLQVSKERYAASDGWEPIPFFQAVYHPYAVFYGNYSSLTMPPYDDLWPREFAPKEPLRLLDRKYSRQFRMEQARAFVWGLQPTIANFLPAHLQERAEETDFMMRLARLRMQGLKYFLHGTLLRPPDIGARRETIDLSRLSIYAGQQGALKSFRREYATALGAAWRAPDGTVAVALVNMDDAPQSLSVNLDRQQYGLPENGMIYRIDETGRKAIGTFDSRVEMMVPISAGGACVIEFVRK